MNTDLLLGIGLFLNSITLAMLAYRYFKHEDKEDTCVIRDTITDEVTVIRPGKKPYTYIDKR